MNTGCVLQCGCAIIVIFETTDSRVKPEVPGASGQLGVDREGGTSGTAAA